ncbi:uncharacterized protein CC84DRAFT_1211075 [Paraphaeosphaeria sporulosa]|uniref:Uncharacterized protein n=1 Tax=Paraphaeosphaeria sporulosa TaxID=1460663 RepID=A0A177CV29_9PLEO|nr:uncharacterized protein CC84DRAFT_1211075 [Paraphaeosphaeria sporulosa]OAG11414.1 hypothetical protein CC84DRAFT_1211075 [Paraphaeosphaeria sporulosa]
MAVFSAPLQSQCYFFNIPPELRNAIYEYALTEFMPLLCTAGDATGSPKLLLQYQPGDKEARREANQLRYVCRQLNYEARTLSLRYNDIHFHGIENFESFLLSSMHTLHRRFRNVIILDDHESLKKSYTINQLIDRSMSPVLYTFCSRNPKARVVIRNSRRFTEGAWLTIYVKLRQTLREDMEEKMETMFDAETAGLIKEGSISLRRDLVEKYQRPFLQNLRIAPTADYPQMSTYWTDVQLAEAKRLYEEGC